MAVSAPCHLTLFPLSISVSRIHLQSTEPFLFFLSSPCL